MTPEQFTCATLIKKIKLFQDDLLMDAEYQAAIRHINGCAQCKTYVAALGSLSNELWKMGEVDVPSDFKNLVLVKWRERSASPIQSASVKVLGSFQGDPQSLSTTSSPPRDIMDKELLGGILFTVALLIIFLVTVLRN